MCPLPCWGKGYAPRVAKTRHIYTQGGALATLFSLIYANSLLALKILFEFTSNSPLICSANVCIERNLMIPSFPDGGRSDLVSFIGRGDEGVTNSLEVRCTSQKTTAVRLFGMQQETIWSIWQRILFGGQLSHYSLNLLFCRGNQPLGWLAYQIQCKRANTLKLKHNIKLTFALDWIHKMQKLCLVTFNSGTNASQIRFNFLWKLTLPLMSQRNFNTLKEFLSKGEGIISDCRYGDCRQIDCRFFENGDLATRRLLPYRLTVAYSNPNFRTPQNF